MATKKKKQNSLFKRIQRTQFPFPAIIVMLVFGFIGMYLLVKSFAYDPPRYGSSDSIQTDNNDPSQANIVAFAQGQLGVAENPNGCNCGGKINEFTENNPQAWCADFVSWVYKQAGTPFNTGTGWRIPLVTAIHAYIESFGIWYDRAGAGLTNPPRQGDAVHFVLNPGAKETNNHIGIVIGVRNGELVTIEGNSSNQVKYNYYPDYIHDARIVGWGHLLPKKVDQQKIELSHIFFDINKPYQLDSIN